MKLKSKGLGVLLASALLGLAPVADASLVGRFLEQVQEKAKAERTEADLRALSAALMMYKLNAGNFPSEEQGLAALVTRPEAAPIPKRWIKVMDKVPQDAWGSDYRYFIREKDGKTEHVIACGRLTPDGIELVLDRRGD